ncbi:MAG: hypothetical protein K9N23_01370 [Akkermansiaceae bacterium]|nr:hypothetical protein [Akkermansiaceae bacterium]MCF7730300.1 hypothetical protein [Akkermansiaceae bacterium]
MIHPLGSFPRFGHQERWARERRVRAIANSILTRQANAEYNLHKEIAFHDLLQRLAQGMHALSDKGERQIAELTARLDAVRRHHEAGRRVYFGKLAGLLLDYCEVTGSHPELREMSRDHLKRTVENLAFMHMQGSPSSGISTTHPSQNEAAPSHPHVLTPVKTAVQNLIVGMAGYTSSIKSIADLPPGKLVESFQRVRPKVTLTAEEARHAIGKMFRGATLMKYALGWKQPTVGSVGKSAPVRGLQWRLVMAYSVYEQIENAVFGEECHSKPPRKDALSSIRVRQRLPGPVLSQREMERIERREAAADELCEFLGVREPLRNRFTAWLLGHQLDGECDTARSLFIIAQLRHLAAHGALSADRAGKLGLAPGFSAVPPVLHEMTGALPPTLFPNQN